LASTARRLGTLLQWALAGAVLWFAGRAIARQWTELGPALARLDVRWSLVALSGVVFLAAYALLIQVWRSTLAAWHDTLPFAVAARIWFVSNLGKYLPGKVWQIAAMGVMAQRHGVSPVAAVGSSLIVNLVSVVAGFAILLSTAGGAFGRTNDGKIIGVSRPLLALLAGGGLLLLLATPWIVPRAASLAARLFRRPLGPVRVPARAVWVGALGTAAAWVLYGFAFQLLAAGTLGPPTGATWAYIAVYTSSYLAGYLALLTPGGLGVREAVMVLAMPQAGLATTVDATVLAVASRLWLTVLEILPGLLLLARGDARWRPRKSIDEVPS
jgi:hypothetical protein